MTTYYVLAVLATFLAAVGQVALKRYGRKQQRQTLAVRDFHFVISVAAFLASTGLGIYIMRVLDFSAYYAMTALNVGFIALLSALYLQERIDVHKVAGIILIVVGLVVFNI